MEMKTDGFEVGEKLRLRWTSNGQYYSAIVEITKINKKSVRIKLVDDVPKGYKQGRTWRVSTKIVDQTKNNCFIEI